MYKNLDNQDLNLSDEYLKSLSSYLSHPTVNIRKLIMLVICIRLKFSKKFRRRWISLYPEQCIHKKIIISLQKQGHRSFIQSVDSQGLKYNLATIFYQISNDHIIHSNTEYNVTKNVVTRNLRAFPDPKTVSVWFDRVINTKIKKSLKEGSPAEDLI